MGQRKTETETILRLQSYGVVRFSSKCTIERPFSASELRCDKSHWEKV
jgi:hypothetical protein